MDKNQEIVGGQAAVHETAAPEVGRSVEFGEGKSPTGPHPVGQAICTGVCENSGSILGGLHDTYCYLSGSILGSPDFGKPLMGMGLGR